LRRCQWKLKMKLNKIIVIGVVWLTPSIWPIFWMSWQLLVTNIKQHKFITETRDHLSELSMSEWFGIFVARGFSHIWPHIWKLSVQWGLSNNRNGKIPLISVKISIFPRFKDVIRHNTLNFLIVALQHLF
jgi:hypothetical protein